MDMRPDLDRHLSVDYSAPGFERPHDLTTDYIGRERRQENWCHDCGARTLGTVLPALPCPGKPEVSR